MQNLNLSNVALNQNVSFTSASINTEDEILFVLKDAKNGVALTIRNGEASLTLANGSITLNIAAQLLSRITPGAKYLLYHKAPEEEKFLALFNGTITAQGTTPVPGTTLSLRNVYSATLLPPAEDLREGDLVVHEEELKLRTATGFKGIVVSSSSLPLIGKKTDGSTIYLPNDFHIEDNTVGDHNLQVLLDDPTIAEVIVERGLYNFMNSTIMLPSVYKPLIFKPFTTLTRLGDDALFYFGGDVPGLVRFDETTRIGHQAGLTKVFEFDNSDTPYLQAAILKTHVKLFATIDNGIVSNVSIDQLSSDNNGTLFNDWDVISYNSLAANQFMIRFYDFNILSRPFSIELNGKKILKRSQGVETNYDATLFVPITATLVPESDSFSYLLTTNNSQYWNYLKVGDIIHLDTMWSPSNGGYFMVKERNADSTRIHELFGNEVEVFDFVPGKKATQLKQKRVAVYDGAIVKITRMFQQGATAFQIATFDTNNDGEFEIDLEYTIRWDNN